jgi:hypothetical protein
MDVREAARKCWDLGRPYLTVPIEAFFIVVLSQLPVVLASFLTRADLPNDQLSQSTFFADIFGRYSLNDVFIYATGVLGSTMVFFVLNYRLLSNEIRIVFTGLIIPLVIIFFSALIPVSTMLNDAAPNDFVQTYSFWIFILLLVAWIVALFEQRNLDLIKFDLNDSQQVDEMARSARSGIG